MLTHPTGFFVWRVTRPDVTNIPSGCTEIKRAIDNFRQIVDSFDNYRLPLATRNDTLPLDHSVLLRLGE